MGAPPAASAADVARSAARLDRSRLGLLSGLALLAGCATTPHGAPTRSPPPRSASSAHGRPSSVQPSRPSAPFSAPAPSGSLVDLPGWGDEDHATAFTAFAQACGASREQPMQAACAEARAAGPLDEGHARRWFERRFRPAPLVGEGVLTAYFAPVYAARWSPDAEFTAPVRPRPGAGATTTVASGGGAPYPTGVADPLELLAEGAPPPTAPAPAYASSAPLLSADRTTIETNPADGALAWMRPEDLFFLQIQGSGVLVMEDGRRMKALYAADNGRPFTAIARTLVQDGALEPNRASGDNIRAWLHAHAGPQAAAAMRRNARYIFFALQPDDGREPAGAAGVALPSGRALAVDPSRHAYGELYWIDAEAPVLAGAARRYRRLALSLDTGAAIRGEVRADLYMGSGDEAGREAGRVRHTLRMVRLVPIEPGA